MIHTPRICASGSSAVRRHLTAVLVLAISGLSQACADRVRLPAIYQTGDMLRASLAEASSTKGEIIIGATARAGNNLGALSEIADAEQSVRVFTGDTAYAQLEIGEWVRFEKDGWWVGYGTGRRDNYEGNDDAAQLWIDLHSGRQSRPDYTPRLVSERIDVSWFAVGRRFRIGPGSRRWTAELSIRRFIEPDYKARVLKGETSGSIFTRPPAGVYYKGIMRTISAHNQFERSPGAGWCVDAGINLRLNERWFVRAAAEGLAGRIRWKNAYAQDAYITSPGLFMDADGFLRATGGISGSEWRQDLLVGIEPRLRLDLAYSGRRILLASVEQSGPGHAEAAIGIGWPRGGRWLPYVRWRFSPGQMELGAVCRSWQAEFWTDDASLSSSQAGFSISLTPLRF